MGQRTYSDVQEDGTLLAWEVERLWELTKDYPRKHVPLSAIGDFDLVCWFDGKDHLPTAKAWLLGLETIEAVQFEVDPEPDERV